MDFLEKDLEQIIWETSDEYLWERGLPISGHRKRQLKIGNYGIADIVTFERVSGCLNITIYEFKKDCVNVDTLLQALRYQVGIERYLKLRGVKTMPLFTIVLVGRKIDKSNDFCYIPSLANNIHIYSYSYRFYGIIFKEECGYKLVEEGFCHKSINSN